MALPNVFLKSLMNYFYTREASSGTLRRGCEKAIGLLLRGTYNERSLSKDRSSLKRSSHQSVASRSTVSVQRVCIAAALLVIATLGSFPLNAGNSSAQSPFNPVISSLSDRIGDVDSSYGYIDVVHAEVRQTSLTKLQFEITVRSAVPLNPGNNTIVYLWMVDTDLNPSTGQRHVFVGSEYNVRVAFYDSHWQCWVDTIGQRPGGGQCSVFVKNNTISAIVDLSQIGGATRFNWEVSAFDKHANDWADSSASVQILSELPKSSMVSEVLLTPSYLNLADGVTSGKLSVIVKDMAGRRLALSSAEFFADCPSAVSVTDSGVVRALAGKFGTCWITAKVDGVLSSNRVEVNVGSVTLLPPVLLLSVQDNPRGMLAVEVRDAYGNAVSPSKVEFFSSNPEVATVSSDGLVTALRPPHSFWETPYITVKVDGVEAANSAIVRVTDKSLGLTLERLDGKHVTFYIPRETVQGFDYELIFRRYDVVRITDMAYELELEATGAVPYRGGRLFLVNDPGHGADGTVPCGLSGNPIRLGTDVDKPIHDSCMIVAFGSGSPQWFVYFHEMGHDFLLGGSRIRQFFSGSKGGTYSEALATALGMYVAKMLESRQSLFNISDDILRSVKNSVWHFGQTPSLDEYLKKGARYDEITADVLDEIIDVICTRYGYDSLRRFFSLLLPRDVPFTFTVDSDAKQATLFVAAMSAATGADLRREFKQWGFPVDDEYYTAIWSEVNQLVNPPPVKPGFTLRVNLPSPAFWVKVDSDNRSAFSGTFRLSGGDHVIQVPAQFYDGGVRYLFSRWSDGSTANPRSVVLTGDLNLTALYVAQVLVKVDSSYSSVRGGGWVTKGELVTVGVDATVVDHGNGTRRVFSGWFVDNSLLSRQPVVSFTATEGVHLVAGWDTEYEVQVVSERGTASGGGWVRAGARTTVSVSQTVIAKDPFTNYVFEGWKVGDMVVSTSPSYSFTVTGPVVLVASWKEEPNSTASGLQETCECSHTAKESIIRMIGAVVAGMVLVGTVVFLVLRRSRDKQRQTTGRHKPGGA